MESTNQPTYQPIVWQQIVRQPYADCSGFIQYLTTVCDRVLVGQHDADEKVTTTHCHIMMVSPAVTTQAIEKARKKFSITGAGNSLMKVTEKTRVPYEYFLLGKYCLKGVRSNLVFSFSVPDVDIAKMLSMWVISPAVQDDEKPKNDKTHFALIRKLWNDLQLISDIWTERLEFNNSGEMKTLNEKGRDKAFEMLVERLNDAEIRTSRNELERFYVTLLRLDKGQARILKELIIKNVFR